MTPTQPRIITTAVGVLALITVTAGLWAMVSPRTFYVTLAPFPPYNTHLIHDIGAFQIGLGTCLVAGLLVRDALFAVLAGNATGATAHFVSHVVDRLDGGRDSDPAVFGALALLLILLTVRRARNRAAIPTGHRPWAIGHRQRRPLVKRAATAILWIALAAQAGWVILNGLVLHRFSGFDALGAVILVSLTAFAALHSRPGWGWLAVVVRTLMAADFLLAVADRFGLLGPPGASGVVSGDFSHFIDYTRSIASFVPGSFAPTLAVLATIAEVTLATALLLGVRLRLTALAAALLLATYGTSMMISLPAAEQFRYNVFLLAAGMLELATIRRSPLTLDAVLGQRPRPRRAPFPPDRQSRADAAAGTVN